MKAIEPGWVQIKPEHSISKNLLMWPAPPCADFRIQNIENFLESVTKSEGKPYCFEGHTLEEVMVIGKYKSAEIFSPLISEMRIGALLVEPGGFYDYNHVLVQDVNAKVASRFLILAKIQA